MPTRIHCVLSAALACLVLSSVTHAASLGVADPVVRIGVFGLFHSRQLTVRAHDGQAVKLHCGAPALRIEGGQSIRITLRGESIECRSGSVAVQASLAEITNPGGDFVLGVTGKIERHYRGALTIVAAGSELRATVAMPVEVAVGSVVAAEAEGSAPLDALKAQAVVARSYIAAGPRHGDFDFCDTTHCQYLTAPPAPGEDAMQAVSATRGMVLSYEGDVVRALYSARCGGQTHTLADIGLNGGDYPYYRARCSSCIRAPDPWVRTLDEQQAVNLIRQPGNEMARLRLVRERGWQALPSNNYRISATAAGATLEGAGSGHGVGLCQLGAQGMAAEGHGLLSILRHYFPNTTLRPAAVP